VARGGEQVFPSGALAIPRLLGELVNHAVGA
jgi:hypothetical protein